MTDREADKIIYQGLMYASARERERELALLADVNFEPSLAHRLSMRAMCKDPLKWRRDRSRPLWKRMAQTAASILLVLLLTFTAVMAVSPTARAAVKNWLLEWYEEHVFYQFTDEVTQGDPADYELTYIPEGYVEVERFKQPIYQYVLYQNNDGSFLRFESQVMKTGNATTIETKGMEMTEINILRYRGEILLSEDNTIGNAIIWRDVELNLQFSIQGFIGEKTLITMAKSVKPK